jgi:hypothetical protein
MALLTFFGRVGLALGLSVRCPSFRSCVGLIADIGATGFDVGAVYDRDHWRTVTPTDGIRSLRRIWIIVDVDILASGVFGFFFLVSPIFI